MAVRSIQSFILVVCCAAFLAGPAAAQGGGPQKPERTPTIAGWVENGWIGSPPIKVKVKLDTGAKTSSINAAQYRDYKRDGVRRVSFILLNNAGEERTIDKPVLRTATIRRAGVEKRQRPVIRLEVCVAGVTSEVEFTMADRSALRYPILIGRSFLAGKIFVDSNRTFIASNRCGGS